MSHIHRGECTALSISRDGRYLLTAGDKVVKVWDYNMALDLNFQVVTYSTLNGETHSHDLCLDNGAGLTRLGFSGLV